jgi:hypothetical protein
VRGVVKKEHHHLPSDLSEVLLLEKGGDLKKIDAWVNNR